MATTREEVLDAVTGLLSHDASATTTEIARAAGVSRATLGRLFADRDELVRALLQRCVQRVVRAVDRAVERHGSGEALVPVLVEEVFPEALAFAFLAAQPAVYGEEADRIYDSISRRLDALVRDAQRAGDLRDDLPATWISDVLHILPVGGAESLRLGRIAAREATALVTEALLNGIGPREAASR
ncbi:MAG TPA: TetR/AcrR family transcriptional regulator [Pseudonocardia sp.]|nr:TetR/AcrR family transcriptional regulator [Pseudonocardia sp.]